MNHTGDQKQQTKGQKINTQRQIYWSKNRDFETASSKNRDSETQTTAEKTRLRDPWKSAKILRDPNFLKDHLPPLIQLLHVTETRVNRRTDGPLGSYADFTFTLPVHWNYQWVVYSPLENLLDIFCLIMMWYSVGAFCKT